MYIHIFSSNLHSQLQRPNASHFYDIFSRKFTEWRFPKGCNLPHKDTKRPAMRHGHVCFVYNVLRQRNIISHYIGII